MSSLSVPKIAVFIFLFLVIVGGGLFLKLGLDTREPQQTLVRKDISHEQMATRARQGGGLALPALPVPKAAPIP